MIPNYPFDPAPFTCMHFWHDKGADLYLDACNGEEYEVEDGKDYDAGGGHYMPMGSIMVKPGCTAYLNKDHHFGGDKLECITTSGAMSTVAVPAAPRPTDVAASRNLSTVYQWTDMM